MSILKVLFRVYKEMRFGWQLLIPGLLGIMFSSACLPAPHPSPSTIEVENVYVALLDVEKTRNVRMQYTSAQVFPEVISPLSFFQVSESDRDRLLVQMRDGFQPCFLGTGLFLTNAPTRRSADPELMFAFESGGELQLAFMRKKLSVHPEVYLALLATEYGRTWNYEQGPCYVSSDLNDLYQRLLAAAISGNNSVAFTGMRLLGEEQE